MADALMVTSSFLPGRGGIESYLAELARLVSPRLAVLAPGRREGLRLPDGLGYPTHALPGRLVAPGPRTSRAIIKTAEKEGTDRVVFGTPWPLALLGPRLKAAGLRYAVIVHGAELVVPAGITGVRPLVRRALAGAELLLPVSEYTADRLRILLRVYGRPEIVVLRAHVDVERFRPGTGDATRARFGLQGRPLILYFGRLIKRKGVHRLINALPDLLGRVPNAAVLVAGTGPEESSLRRRAARVAPDAVVFAGRVADEDAPAVFVAADVFAMPVADRWLGHEIEGLGVVLLEASAAGVPCVTGRSGGTPEAVLDGRTGFVVNARDRGQLVDRLAELLANPDDARRMGAAAQAHVADTFSERAATEPLTKWLGKDVR